MSSTITTAITAVQVDNAGGVRVDYRNKWDNLIEVTPNGISNIVVVLTAARASKMNVVLSVDGDGNILGATF